MNCDICSSVIINYNFYPIEKLKHNIESVDKNKTAILCPKCFEVYKK